MTPPCPSPLACCPAGGAWLTQVLLLLLGSISASMPVIAAAFTGVIAAWLQAVFRSVHGGCWIVVCVACCRHRCRCWSCGSGGLLRFSRHEPVNELKHTAAGGLRSHCLCSHVRLLLPACLPAWPAAWASSSRSMSRRRPAAREGLRPGRRQTPHSTAPTAAARAAAARAAHLRLQPSPRRRPSAPLGALFVCVR